METGNEIWSSPALVFIGLAAVSIFLAWMVFSDRSKLGSNIDQRNQDQYPVPKFNREAIDIPVAPRAQRQPISYRRSSETVEPRMENWAKELHQSVVDARAASVGLVEKYKDVPTQRKRKESPTGNSSRTKKAKAAKSRTKKATTTKKSTPKPKVTGKKSVSSRAGKAK